MKSARSNFSTIYILFFISGMAGLSYEVIWMRKLSLILGATAPAVSAVVAAYLFGLAVGAYLYGRYSDRFGDPLKAYGYMEGMIGIYCALTPLLFGLFGLIESSIGKFIPNFLGIPWRFTLALIMMAVPTALMGATLPALIKALSPDREPGKGVGNLYGINTAGAAIGAMTAGFVTIPFLGEIGATFTAALMNIAVAVFVVKYLFMPAAETSDTPAKDKSTKKEQTDTLSPKIVMLCIALFAFAGFVSITYEVYWTRLLSLIIGTTTYAFTIMLATFIIGIGLGSIACSRFADRFKSPVLFFGLIEIGIAITVLAGMPFIDEYPNAMVSIYARTGGDFTRMLFYIAGIAALVMFPTTFLMGAAFPVIGKIVASGGGSLSRSIGAVYAFNTVGGIIGSIAGAFFIMPMVGTQMGILLSAGMNLGIGVVAAVMSKSKGWLKPTIPFATIAVVLLFVASKPWNYHKIACGIYFRLDDIKLEKGVTLDDLLTSENVLFFKEDASATVMVVKDRLDKTMSIVINGKPEASTGLTDLAIEYMLGHLPVILADNPKNALVVGMGTGTTFGAVGSHSFLDATLAEISPAVIPAARLFGFTNHNVHDMKNVKIVRTDGRHFLMRSPKNSFDVITSDPIHPFNPGGSSLYTLDYYKLAESRLGDGGVFCQWLPLYQLTREDMRTIVATFIAAFPESTLWMARTDALLIGHKGKARVNLSRILERFEKDPAYIADMKRIGIGDGLDLAAHLTLGPDDLRKLSAGASVTTDNRNILEFSSPRSLFKDTVEDNWRFFRDSRNDAVYGLIEGDADSIAKVKSDAKAIDLVNEATFLVFKDDLGAAADKYSEALKIAPENLAARMDISSLILKKLDALVAENKGSEAKALADSALKIYPENAVAMIWVARYVAMKGDFGYARNLLDHARSLMPWDADILADLGLVYFSLGRQDEAFSILKDAMKLEPDRARPYINMAIILEETGRKAEALQAYREALMRDPSNQEAYQRAMALKDKL